MKPLYKSVKNEASIEIIEKKSHFIGSIARTETEAEALDFIKKIKLHYADASHNVYAYIITENIIRFNDNGEPSGTAGKPVLEVINREGLSRVTCVITRYFGGILLGAGGLIRVYAKAAKTAVDSAGIIEVFQTEIIKIIADYKLAPILDNYLKKNHNFSTDTEYNENVNFITTVYTEEKEELIKNITELTNGKVVVRPYKNPC